MMLTTKAKLKNIMAILSTLLEADNVCVPDIPHRALKNFWNDNLNYLKQQSIDIHELWKSVGNHIMD